MTTVATDTGVGPLLRGWREQRRLSQLELALRADSSARHISFIETGRSRPSEEMILRLAEHLEVPVRERNALLLAAGYAPRFTESTMDAPLLESLREGIGQLLQGYEPYPALVVDGSYTVLAANQGIGMLLAGLPEHLLTPPLNAMRITLHPEGLAPRIRNLREWRGHLLAQMERQIGRSGSVRSRCGRCTRRWRVSAAGGGRRPGGPGGRGALPVLRAAAADSSTTGGCCRSCRRSRRSTRRWT
ncbi:hypothetical protein GCM10019017_16150 [Streptomyces showdoensis]